MGALRIHKKIQEALGDVIDGVNTDGTIWWRITPSPEQQAQAVAIVQTWMPVSDSEPDPTDKAWTEQMLAKLESPAGLKPEEQKDVLKRLLQKMRGRP